jgi:phosphohistidine phosphatase
MRLYLVQHGEAEPKEKHANRPLTSTGRNEIGRTAEFVKRAGIRLHEIRHSRKLRAQQSAEVIGKQVKAERGVVAADGLAPKDNVEAVAAGINEQNEDIMLVGHLPFLERLATFLVTGNADAQPIVRFQRGGCCCLEREQDEGKWAVLWMVVPEVLLG